MIYVFLGIGILLVIQVLYAAALMRCSTRKPPSQAKVTGRAGSDLKARIWQRTKRVLLDLEQERTKGGGVLK